LLDGFASFNFSLYISSEGGRGGRFFEWHHSP
jgi:hypothetical protein